MDMVPPSVPAGFSFSQSSLQDYSDCPRRFQLRYVDQLHWPAVETEPVLEIERRQREGQVFHRLVQQHLIGIPAERLAPYAQSPDLYRWWENYLAYKFDFFDFTKHTELTLTSPVGIYRLTAKYDLIAVRPGMQAIIYDWKTYHKRPRNEWMAVRWQTRVYRVMLIQAGAQLNNGTPFLPEQTGMVYWFAEHPNEPARFTYKQPQFNRDWEALTRLIDEIGKRRDFPLTEEEQICAYCPFRSYCDRGTTGGKKDELVDTELSETDINYEQIAEIEY